MTPSSPAPTPSELEALRLLRETVGAKKCRGCGWYQLPGRKCPTEGCPDGE